MDLSLYLAFVLATSILILIPGPNVSLIVANSVAYGTRYGLLTVGGTSTAVLVQVIVTALGMTAVLGTLAYWFEWIRWIGVAYLVYIGIQQWRADPIDLTRTKPQPKSFHAIYLRGLLVSLSNPKTMLFFGAFFPQFISMEGDPQAQIILLCATFLVIAALLDGAWAVLAGHVRWFLGSRGRLRNRLSGGLLIGAGLGLALARRS
ncbi:MAG TPA: LysE family translocator [Stellaceae bacterium]|nr:LysE family translocator [Stellaceae bacterium]